MPLDFPNKGYWCKVLQARCPSWHKPAETQWASLFSASTTTPEGKGREVASFCIGCLMPCSNCVTLMMEVAVLRSDFVSPSVCPIGDRPIAPPVNRPPGQKPPWFWSPRSNAPQMKCHVRSKAPLGQKPPTFKMFFVYLA